MGRTRETVDAAVLTAAIRIDRSVEANVRTLVARQNGLCIFSGQGRIDALGLILLRSRPAVVEAFATVRLEPTGFVRSCGPPPAIDLSSMLQIRRCLFVLFAH